VSNIYFTKDKRTNKRLVKHNLLGGGTKT